MSNHERTDGRSRCLLPWILLGVVLVMLFVSLVWGYTRRHEVAEYAVAAMIDQQLGEMVPPGQDATKVATRISSVLKAVKNGQLDAEALAGFGTLFRQYYTDHKLDAQEFESLLSFAEAAIIR